jgi:uncharacterized protein
MIRVALISDTHSYLDEHILGFCAECDEIWHAGDLGSTAVAERLEACRPLRAVFGNIDDRDLQLRFPEDLHFEVEGLRVWMTHIGGYPGRYSKRVKDALPEYKPGLFICGHSHILKAMPDRAFGLLHLNPGACGQEGFHHMRTMMRFNVAEGVVQDLQVIELGKRGALV